MKADFEVPQNFWDKHSEGSVTLRVIVGTDGRITSPEILQSSGPDYSAIAQESVLRWQYHPVICRGAPISFYLTVTVNFTKSGKSG